MRESHIESLVTRTLAVFAKRPEPGRVKTRLATTLGADAAAALYWAMLQDVWRLAKAVSDRTVLFTNELWDGFEALDGAEPQLQVDNDLGGRMYHCLWRLSDADSN